MITELLIIILIIVIIILFCKILEFENFNIIDDNIKNNIETLDKIKSVGLEKKNNMPDLDNKALKEEDKINKLIVNNNINNDNKTELKQNNKTELNQDVNIELLPKNDNNFSYNTTKHDINKLIKEEENKDKEKEKEKNNKEIKNKLQNINPNKEKEEEEEIIKSNLTYSTKDIDKEMNKRYENQPEEYKQSFYNNKNTGFIYKDNVITDENIYTFEDFNYISAHQLFIPTNYKTKPEDYGRNYIPPELWYKNNQRLNLPVCVPANARCIVQDNPTIGYPYDSIEWYNNNKVLNPDGINIKYVREKLNTKH